MNIAVLAESCDLYSGSRAALDLAIALKQNKSVKDVFFTAFSSNQNPEAIKRLKSAGVHYFLLPNKNGTLISKLISGRALLKVSQIRNADILSLHVSLPLYIWARSLNKPLLYTYYGTQFNAYLENRFGLRNTFVHRFINLFFNSGIYLLQAIPLWTSRHIVSLSKFCTLELKKYYGIKAPHIYFGSDSSSNNLPSYKDKSSIRLISISRFTPYKGFHSLIQIVAKLNQEAIKAKLYIIGSHPKMNYLKFLRKFRYRWLTIKNTVSEKTRQHLIKHSQIYLSFDQYSFLGLPLIEAAMNGLPAVAMDYCAASEIVEDQKTGYLAKTELEFFIYLKRLCRNVSLRQKMSVATRARAFSLFDWKKCSNQYFLLFNRILRR